MLRSSISRMPTRPSHVLRRLNPTKIPYAPVMTTKTQSDPVMMQFRSILFIGLCSMLMLPTHNKPEKLSQYLDNKDWFPVG